jgi:hypothetical protein
VSVLRRSLLAALVLLIAVPASAQAGGRDVSVLFHRAVLKVQRHADFADAVVLEADGAPKGRGAIDGAAQIERWLFVFQNTTEGSEFASVTIAWRRGEGFAQPKGHRSPFLEDVPIKKEPKMSVNDALDLMDEAGFGREFFNVVLRRPLGPERTPPLYIFEVAQGTFVAVNTKTGDVEPID